MAVSRYYNPVTGQWEVLVRGHQGPKGDKGDQGPKGEKGDGSGDVLWSELNPVLDGKAPESHGHTIAEVTGLEDALASAGSAEHTHTVSEVTGLQSALAGKADATHTHTQAQVTGLVDALAGKANSSHTHTTAQVTGLDSALAGKANSSHTHTTAQVTGLDSALAGKASSTHNHPVTEITATGTRGSSTYLRGDGTWATPPNTDTTYAVPTQAEAEAGTATTGRAFSAQRVAQAIAAKAAPKTHTHTMAEITDLPTVSSQNSLNTIAQRDGSGHINVGLAPSQINHAASKFYVDTTRKGVIHSGSGGVPATIPGAVAGDFWLNTDTMELHKITAV